MEKAGLVRPAFSEFGSGPYEGGTRNHDNKKPQCSTQQRWGVKPTISSDRAWSVLLRGDFDASGRTRTPAWYSKQLAVKHSKHWDKVVYEKVGLLREPKSRAVSHAYCLSVRRVAREVLCSDRTRSICTS